MEILPLSIPGSFVVNPQIFEDSRGAFLEWYRADKLEEVLGYSLNLQQANSSVSKKGVVRGIHFADLGPGQAKYVTCPFGAVLDFIVDIRVGSPTFGKWDSVVISDENRKAVYLSEGLGHAFVSLTEDAYVNYLVSDKYKPGKEHGINPLDPEIALELPFNFEDLSLSEKDLSASSLNEMKEAGMLPSWEQSLTQYEQMKKVSGL